MSRSSFSRACFLCGSEEHLESNCPNKERMRWPAHRVCMLHWECITSTPEVCSNPEYYFVESTKFITDNMKLMMLHLHLSTGPIMTVRAMCCRIQLIYHYLALRTHGRRADPFTFDNHGETYEGLARFDHLIVRPTGPGPLAQVTGPSGPGPLAPRTERERIILMAGANIGSSSLAPQPSRESPVPLRANDAHPVKNTRTMTRPKIRVHAMAEDCPICLSVQCNVSVQCGHSFCDGCVNRLLDRSVNLVCAICRTEVTGIVCKDAEVSKLLSDRMS